MDKRGQDITLVGKIISNKMQKTVTVEVTTKGPHPKYDKIVDRKSKFYAHVNDKIEIGTKVKIRKTRPLSKMKNWKVVEVI